MLRRFKTALDWPFNVSGRGRVSDPFGDYDGDGLHNLNDCRPRNPKKQDISKYLKVSKPPISKYIASKPVSPPQQMSYSSQPKQNINYTSQQQKVINNYSSSSSFPKKNVVLPQKQLPKLPKKQITIKTIQPQKIVVQKQNFVSSNNVTQKQKKLLISNNNKYFSKVNINGISDNKPEMRKLTPPVVEVNRDKNYKNIEVPEKLHRKYEKIYAGGINKENVMALQRVQDSGIVASPDEQNKVAASAYGYLEYKKIPVSRNPTSTKDETFVKDGQLTGTSAYYDSIDKKIALGPFAIYENPYYPDVLKTQRRDENATLLHETSHAIQDENRNPKEKRPQLKYKTISTSDAMNNDIVKEKLKDYDFNTDRAQYESVKNIIRDSEKDEAKAQYIGAYYRGEVPKNRIVDEFEYYIGANSQTRSSASLSDVVRAGNAYTEMGRNYRKYRNIIPPKQYKNIYK